jgi:hypothetical protein
MESNYQGETKQIIRKNKAEYLMGGETFVGAASSIHVQPAEQRRQTRGIGRKTPRWQPRGNDTQSFRPLVQEERGVLRVRVLALSTRVNTVQLCSACGSRNAADSILTERKLTRMKFHSILRSLALTAALASTVPLLAKPFAKTINIAQSAKIGKADLEAGEYRLMIDGNKATIQKGRQTIVESEGRWEDRSTKAANNSVLIGQDGQVKEVRFSGQTRVFVFSE